METPRKASRPGPVPASAGIGLRAEHYAPILERRPNIGFVEVHSENYFGAGGANLTWLERIREHYPLSLHGVGLSLGSVDPVNEVHLAHLKRLITRFQPGLISDHLCWCSVDGKHTNDLFPLPYTEEALDHVVGRIAQVQDYLQQAILIENVSSYLRFSHSTITEWEFFVEAAHRSGCHLLLDVNNVYVNARNHHFDPVRFIDYIPAELIAEIHLAGHAVNRHRGREILIDDHGSRVPHSVWSLFAVAISRSGAVPTLVEWDSNIPPLDVLLNEAEHAARIMDHLNA